MYCKIKFIFLLLSMSYLCGCATMGKSLEMENQKLRTQVITLENDIKEKDLEIESLEIELENLKEQLSNKVQKNRQQMPKATKEFNVFNIQLALKNAGFDPGSIDGKMGKKTRKAIIDFQKSQGLTPDGIIGNATWEKLKAFLDKTIK